LITMVIKGTFNYYCTIACPHIYVHLHIIIEPPPYLSV
jgi:hypothetical protein